MDVTIDLGSELRERLNHRYGSLIVAKMIDDVIRGVKMLDQHDLDWWNRVDLDALDMARANVCVIGQLNGGQFATALGRYGATGDLEEITEWAGSRGLLVWVQYRYALLDVLWRNVIEQRRAEDRLAKARLVQTEPLDLL